MRLKVADVKRLVAIFYGVTRAEMEGARRNRRYSWPRQVAMALCYRYTARGLSYVGGLFNRDHTTVLHATRAVSRRAHESAEHARDLALICAQIEAGAISVSSAWAKRFDREARRITALEDIDARDAQRAAEALDSYRAALKAANANFSVRAAGSSVPSIAACLPGPRVLRLRGPGSFDEAA